MPPIHASESLHGTFCFTPFLSFFIFVLLLLIFSTGTQTQGLHHEPFHQPFFINFFLR